MTHAIALPPAAGLAALTDLQRVYFGYLADYGPRTRKAYEYHLNAYLTWCGHNQIDPLTADRTHVALYVRHLSEERGLRGSTVNTCMTPVKGFYRWAMLEGFIDRDPVVHTKLPKSCLSARQRPVGVAQVPRYRIVTFPYCVSALC